MSTPRFVAPWSALALALAIPLVAAAFSPLLAWRQPVYIVAGFAGVIGLALMLVQPLLILGALPGLSRYRARRVHAWIGAAIAIAVILHVVGLWITSPPDVIDALLFASPTTFSVWGVIAMWAVFASALLAAFRAWLQLRPRTWRVAHTSLAVTIVAGTVVHALLIEGTMETISKVALSAFVIAATVAAIASVPFGARSTGSRRGHGTSDAKTRQT
ncbi:MAG: ferric reductase-like transmembrane domain-containing protein [Pseudomonadota bacterium]